MGGRQRIDQRSGGVVRPLRPVRRHRDPADPDKLFWNSSQKAKVSAIALVACLFLPDAANFHPNPETAWTIYLTAKGMAYAILCLLVAWYSTDRSVSWLAVSVAVVFLAGAVNAATEDYLFRGNVWQYPVAAVLLALTWWGAKKFPGERD